MLDSGLSRLSEQAEAGDIEAQYQVGKCYLEGIGTKKIVLDGVKWLKKRATMVI